MSDAPLVVKTTKTERRKLLEIIHKTAAANPVNMLNDSSHYRLSLSDLCIHHYLSSVVELHLSFEGKDLI